MTDQDESPPQFPLYVRILAIAHVLSLVAGPLGLIVLGGFGCLLFVLRRGVDDTILSLWALGIACPGLGALYRRWFVNWGRRNWPDGKYRDNWYG
ncbi:MAG: hypothetical protein U0872_07960 [Planctomycetaceae bacterium]